MDLTAPQNPPFWGRIRSINQKTKLIVFLVAIALIIFIIWGSRNSLVLIRFLPSDATYQIDGRQYVSNGQYKLFLLKPGLFTYSASAKGRSDAYGSVTLRPIIKRPINKVIVELSGMFYLDTTAPEQSSDLFMGCMQNKTLTYYLGGRVKLVDLGEKALKLPNPQANHTDAGLDLSETKYGLSASVDKIIYSPQGTGAVVLYATYQTGERGGDFIRYVDLVNKRVKNLAEDIQIAGFTSEEKLIAQKISGAITEVGTVDLDGNFTKIFEFKDQAISSYPIDADTVLIQEGASNLWLGKIKEKTKTKIDFDKRVFLAKANSAGKVFIAAEDSYGAEANFSLYLYSEEGGIKQLSIDEQSESLASTGLVSWIDDNNFAYSKEETESSTTNLKSYDITSEKEKNIGLIDVSGFNRINEMLKCSNNLIFNIGSEIAGIGL